MESQIKEICKKRTSKLTAKMKPEIKEKWIKALRSKTYKQGRNCLRNCTNEYCCLGVLCDIAVQNGVIPPPILSLSTKFQYDGETTHYLPIRVQQWASFSESDPYSFSLGGKLSASNDKGVTFDTIANAIEMDF